MKMPDTISENMLAVCGMNCLACYKHCAAKSERQQCPGCLSDSASKPNHCRVCKIAACAGAKGHTRCFECGEFPCGLIKRLEKSYNTRYGESLVANGVFVREKGVAAFMENERKKRACPDCGGIVSLHDKVCGECGKNFKTAERADLAETLRPIASLLSKSEKAQTKLAAGSWQYKMLDGNIKALRILYALMSGESGAGEFSRDDLSEALNALASMISRTESAGAKFAEGTSQHTLQKNRLNALRIAEMLIKRELEDKENG